MSATADQQAEVLKADVEEWEAWRAYAGACDRHAPADVRRSLFRRALEVLERRCEAEREAESEQVTSGAS